jgi:hypothetical protein
MRDGRTRVPRSGTGIRKTVHQFDDAFEISAVVDIDEAPHDFHVLLRHRLLRQPRGFEGIGFGLEEVDADHEAISEPVDHPLRHLAFDSAPLSAS